MMTLLISAALALAATNAGAPAPARDYPSCDLRAQHALGATPGAAEDGGRAHISQRVNILQADIGNARKARHLTQAQADTLRQRVDRVRLAVAGPAQKHGPLGTKQRAAYERTLDAVATRLCRG
jgi:hypothetical protein